MTLFGWIGYAGPGYIRLGQGRTCSARLGHLRPC